MENEMNGGDTEIATTDESYPTDEALAEEFSSLDLNDDGSDLVDDDVQASQEQAPDESQIDHEVDTKTPEEMLKELTEGESNETDENQEEGAETEVDENGRITLKNGEDFKHFDVKNEDQKKELVELAQKGYDYTQKTQALSEDKKAFEKEREDFTTLNEEKVTALEEKYAEFNETIENYNLFDHVMRDIEETDPDVYAVIQEKAQETVKAQNTPFNRALQAKVDTLTKSLEDTRKSFAERDKSEENTFIKKGFDTDIATLRDELKPIADMGLRINDELVKEAWIKGEEANMSVKEAFYASHGEQLKKVYDSKLKLSRAKKQNAYRANTIGNAKTGGLGSLGNDAQGGETLDQMAARLEREYA